jgi:hypothetical protein
VTVEPPAAASTEPTVDVDLETVGRSLIEARLPHSSSVTVVKSLAGGYSDARVLLCDIASDTAEVGEALNGQFIMKVDRSTSGNQSTAHEVFCRDLGPFAEMHVPALLVSVQDVGISVDLYDIAGYSLNSLRTAEHVTDYEDREEACARVAADLLIAQLAVQPAPDYTRSIGEVLQDWLGTDFPDNRRGLLVGDIVGHFGATGSVFRHEGELLPNPIAVFGTGASLVGETMPCFHGPAHGDLHLRNILVRGSRLTRDLAYWLIDVSWSERAPLLYDQAYLELSAFLYGLTHADSGRVLPLLGKIDGEQVVVPVELDLFDGGVVGLVRRIRSETTNVLTEREPRRADVWQKQYLLARIAAGLNWAAKPLDNVGVRRAAFLTAAWATRQLLRKDHAALWVDLAKQDHDQQSDLTTAAAPIPTAEALKLWAPFRAPDSGMDLFLVADSVANRETLIGLAYARWAAVVDLDPESDRAGLSNAVLPTLQAVRHVSVFGSNRQIAPPASSTNWLMGNGWHSRSEATASSGDEWRRHGYLARVRTLVDEVYDGTPYRTAAVLCLRSGHHNDLVDRVVDYVDERYGGITVQLDLAADPTVAGADLDAFLTAITTSLPLSGTEPVPTIPGATHRHVLGRADLHRLSVDLEVLHSEVLSEGLTAAPETDEFWRGRPPTWGELEAQLDVPRDAHRDLFNDLRTRLGDHQLAVVDLDHSPGAGGTTLGRRIAWDLHRTYPTVLLRSYTPTTVERIDEIYQHSGLTVLVVAESADLAESDRDDLFHELRQRNSRAVILWINRTNVRRAVRHKMIDPVSDAERERLIVEYQRRATTPQARQLLSELADAGAATVAAQRLSPFYFGLCAYDAQFEALDPYVQHHLANLTHAQHEVARYLALVTRYAQLGIPTDLVRRWLNSDPPPSGSYGDAELRQILGPDLRHLVVSERGGLRLLHPLIADHVLAGSPEGERLGLAQISVNLIRKVTDYLGPTNESTLRLFDELFIRRKTWSEDGRRLEDFSELIQQMPGTEAGELVFEELTTRCPDEPHFWNHRGRYHIYRIRDDFERAEEFLLHAVEASNGRDSHHLHTLGMVRRFWIENQLDELVQRGAANTPEQVLTAIAPLFDRAMEAFGKAREDPKNDYSWVTPIQLIATVVERLVHVSTAGSLAEFLARGGPTTPWVARQLDQAETLLDGLRSTYADGRAQSRYYTSLSTRLDLLYGDLEALIEQWKNLRDVTDDKTIVGLALARSLYAHAGRDFSKLSDDEVREIVEMAEAPVYSGQATDANLRLWFQAYRRLPEYSETNALERFSWYASTTHSLDANYYLYILHFLRWYRGDEHNQDRIRLYLEECRRLSRLSRRQWSFEWLGLDSHPHPLVHFSELGERRREYDNFWTRPYLLRRVSGVIEDIRGPQAGSIKIGTGRLTAFFAPRNDFLQTRDINKVVDFYLGFSYEGFRAWAVTYTGIKPEALRIAEQHQMAERTRTSREPDRIEKSAASPQIVAGPVATPKPSALPRLGPIDPALLRGIAATMPGDNQPDYKMAIIELILKAREEEQPLTSLHLGEALQTRFGVQSYNEFRGDGTLRAAVEHLGFRTTPHASGYYVELP